MGKIKELKKSVAFALLQNGLEVGVATGLKRRVSGFMYIEHAADIS